MAKIIEVKTAESELAKWKKKKKVDSEGYSKTDKKWYGWSHRARAGFGVGDKVKEDTCGNPKGKEWTIKTTEEAKQMAKDFAESVS